MRSLCGPTFGVQARKVGETALETNQIVGIALETFSCNNDDNPEGCEEYEARFCCAPGMFLVLL